MTAASMRSMRLRRGKYGVVDSWHWIGTVEFCMGACSPNPTLGPRNSGQENQEGERELAS